jgi:hypothetical protein
VGNGYVEPRGARRRIEIVDGVERIRIPMRRNWFLMLFIAVWLTGWTAGGIAAFTQLFTHFEPFLLVWLCGWAVGWVFAASTILFQIRGAETIVAAGGDLEIRSGARPFVRRWRYRGGTIRHLQSAAPMADPFGMRHVQAPFWIRSRSGAVRFDYGAETVHIATSVDEPEGREIVAWLARRLPATAVGTE